MYDLSKDPDELRPFEDVRAESLETRLRAWVGEAEPPKAERVSDVEAVERLRSLGYLD